MRMFERPSESLPEREIKLECVVNALARIERKADIGAHRPDGRVVAQAEARTHLQRLAELRCCRGISVARIDKGDDADGFRDSLARLGAGFADGGPARSEEPTSELQA